MRPIYLLTALLTAPAMVAVAALAGAIGDTSQSIAVAPMVAPLPPLPTVATPFQPVVRVETIQIPPTHGHLWVQISQCASDECAQSIAASTGLNSIDAAIAIYGNSRTIYTAQLVEDGPWLENPDLDGNGHWNEHDRALLMALVKKIN